jgi:hypothetical protein
MRDGDPRKESGHSARADPKDGARGLFFVYKPDHLFVRFALSLPAIPQ